MRIRWYNGSLLVTAGTVAERETLIKVYDFLETLEFGREPQPGPTGDFSDDDDIATVNVK